MSVTPTRPVQPVTPPAPVRARHDPADQTQALAQSFHRLLPTLTRACTPITTEQTDFLHQIARRKRVDGWASFFIAAALTEADGLMLRRALLSIPDHFGLEVNRGSVPLEPNK